MKQTLSGMVCMEIMQRVIVYLNETPLQCEFAV